METRKKTYNKPLLQSEAFVPNEYVAACKEEYGITEYTISCTKPNNIIEDLTGTGHTQGGCRREDAFKITVENGIITKMLEASNLSGYWNTEGPCENIKVNGNPANEVQLSDPNGTYSLTWTTDVGYDMSHSGTLNCATDKYKNMS